MNLRKIVFPAMLLALFLAASAHAQVGVYASVTGERLDGFKCGELNGICASTDGKERPYGGTLGAYYEFRSFGRMRLGGDFRGVFLNSNKSAESYSSSKDLVRHYSALGGVRASFDTRFKLLHPYGEVLGGYAKLGSGFTQLQGLAGLDVELGPFVDLRAIELGAGELFGSGNHALQTVGVGIVFHTSRER